KYAQAVLMSEGVVLGSSFVPSPPGEAHPCLGRHSSRCSNNIRKQWSKRSTYSVTCETICSIASFTRYTARPWLRLPAALRPPPGDADGAADCGLPSSPAWL